MYRRTNSELQARRKKERDRPDSRWNNNTPVTVMKKNQSFDWHIIYNTRHNLFQEALMPISRCQLLTACSFSLQSVCVCVWERDGEKARERERERAKGASWFAISCFYYFKSFTVHCLTSYRMPLNWVAKYAWTNLWRQQHQLVPLVAVPLVKRSLVDVRGGKREARSHH